MSALHNISYGLYVLSAGQNKPNACIINTLIQLTSSPKQIAICVNKTNHTHSLIEESGIFTVSVLDNTATFDLIKQFGFQSGASVDKFADFKNFKTAENKLPFITIHTNAYICAKVVKTVDVGTHKIFIAEVTTEQILNNAPALTYNDYLTKVKPKTSLTKGAWVCKICGFAYMADNLPQDYICPICKHPASDFVWQENK